MKQEFERIAKALHDVRPGKIIPDRERILQWAVDVDAIYKAFYGCKDFDAHKFKEIVLAD